MCIFIKSNVVFRRTQQLWIKGIGCFGDVTIDVNCTSTASIFEHWGNFWFNWDYSVRDLSNI